MKKFRAAAAALLTIFSAPKTSAESIFNDVPAEHWAYNALASLADEGIIEPDHLGNFYGDKNMTRYDLALMIGSLIKNLYEVNVENPSPYSDVPENHPAHDAVAELTAAGIMGGYDDGTFLGERNVTRYELAQIIDNFLRVTEQISDSDAENPFSDIPDEHWARTAVCDIAAENIMGGYPDGTFRGSKNITRYELALILDKINSRYYS